MVSPSVQVCRDLALGSPRWSVLPSSSCATGAWSMLFWLVMFVVGGVAAEPGHRPADGRLLVAGAAGLRDREAAARHVRQRRLQPADHRGGHGARGHHRQGQMAKITPVFDAIDKALPGTRMVDYAQTKNDVFLTDDGRTTYALVYPKPFESFTDVGPDVAMKPILAKASKDTGFDFGVTGYNLLAQGTDDPEAPSLLAETLLGGLGALAVLLFLFASFLALRAAAHRRGLDPHDVHHRAARHLRDRHQLRRAVPHRPRRPRRRGRLLVARGQPMARGTGARPRQPRRRRRRHELRRSRRRRECGHRGHQPLRAARHPGAAAAQHGHRRHADPAGQHRGHPHPAAGPAGRHRPAGSTGRGSGTRTSRRGPGRPGRASSSAGAGSPPASRWSSSAR